MMMKETNKRKARQSEHQGWGTWCCTEAAAWFRAAARRRTAVLQFALRIEALRWPAPGM